MAEFSVLSGQLPCTDQLACRYVTVDEAAGRALYYVLTETKHEHAPLVLWLNG